MRTKYYLFVTALLVGLNAGASAMFADHQNFNQDAKKDSSIIQYRKSYWVELGPGWSTRQSAFSANLNFELNKQLILSLGSESVYSPDELENALTTIFTLGLVPPTYKPGYDINAVNVKLGKAIKGKAGMVVFSGGVSFLKGTQYSAKSELGTKSGVGAAFDIKLMAAKNFIGLSLNPFFNINNIDNYGGLTINLAIGQVHYRK
jgi:hypothetical protein